jgi:peptidoglycan/LPS O-acetylase OafA/YrhL
MQKITRTFAPTAPQIGKTPARLTEIDALRGLAAIAVVLFHYTTRYMELYKFDGAPTFSFSYGHYGVNLFFIISGFVIFMTLEKTRRPMDFVVSRFSRLFPVFWVAIFVTFAITHALGLPGKLVDLGSAVANMLMFHNLFRVPHVDGVYWTLEVELLFYCGMFLLFRVGKLERIHAALIALMLLRVAYFVMERAFGISLPWMLYRLLILSSIPWFAIGIAIYLATSRTEPGAWKAPARTAALAVLTLLVTGSATLATLGAVFGLMVFCAATAWLRWLRSGLFVWLGAISYPLYLIHENIGWSLQLQLVQRGVPTDGIIVITLLASLALATLLHRAVEMPAMAWIRNRYRQSQTLRQAVVP